MAEKRSTDHRSRRNPASASTRRLPAWLWRRRQRPDRELGRQWRAFMPDAASSRRMPRNLRHVADGSAMVRPDDARSGRALDGCVKARPTLDAFLDAELAKAQSRRFGAGARRFQPGHDDGAARACGARPGLHPRLFRRAGRRRHLAEGDRATRRRIAPADPARAWRHGRGHPGRGAVHVGRRPSKADIPCNGTCRAASATASTRRDCCTADRSSRRIWNQGSGVGSPAGVAQRR